MTTEQLDLIIMTAHTIGCCIMFGLGFLCNEMGAK